jgi:hypothetical protein
MADILLSAIILKNDDDPVSFCIGDTKQNIEALEALKAEPSAEERRKGVLRAFADLLVKMTCFYEGVYAYGTFKRNYANESSNRILSSSEVKQFQLDAENAFRTAAEEKYESFKSLGSERL